MLEDWRGMDKEKAKEFILNCQVLQVDCSWAVFFYVAILLWLSMLHSFFILANDGYQCTYTYIQLMPYFQSYDGGFGIKPGSESHGESK